MEDAVSRLGDATVFELGDDGLIRRMTPHLRPWVATTAFALALFVKLAPDPGLVVRAMRPASAGAGIAERRDGHGAGG